MATSHLRVLVADDDAMARLGYRAMLEGVGHAVLLAHDGEEAMRLVEKGGIDVMLLDILMPRKEGLETLRDVKRRFPALLVVAMSAGCPRSDIDLLGIAAKFGADRTLHKPFDQHALISLMSELTPMVRVMGA